MSTVFVRWFSGVCVVAMSGLLLAPGCRWGDKKTPQVGTITKSSTMGSVSSSPRRQVNPARTPTAHQDPPPDTGEPIRRVRCIYDQKPWLNLDAEGDRDPEGVMIRTFLDTGTQYGVHREGKFHVEMYKIVKVSETKVERKLASDWHYSTSEIPKIKTPGMLGDGYVLHLVWATKDVAGHEVEFIVQYEDPKGNLSRSGTKRLRVPKYTT